jgi:hypothetical protein
MIACVSSIGETCIILSGKFIDNVYVEAQKRDRKSLRWELVGQIKRTFRWTKEAHDCLQWRSLVLEVLNFLGSSAIVLVNWVFC